MNLDTSQRFSNLALPLAAARRWAFCLFATIVSTCAVAADADADKPPLAGHSRPAERSEIVVLPDDGRATWIDAFDRAKREIRIEICVLEDSQLLQRVQAALQRGVRVRVIVDRVKYESAALASEREHLKTYVTDAGGELHLSNPAFPRSFPKLVLIDSALLIYGSACLDSTTFEQYRDFAHVTTDRRLIREVEQLIENDWLWTAAPDGAPPPFNPTPLAELRELIVAPVNAAERMVQLYQSARRTLDVYTELLGNPTLESELVAAVLRGVKVRLIAPQKVNGVPPEQQDLQLASLAALAAAGVNVHVSGPEESAALPYMHARAAIVDGEVAYLGSVSLGLDSIAANREAGFFMRRKQDVRRLGTQFESDYQLRSKPF